MKTKKTIIFLDSSLSAIEDYADELLKQGYQVKGHKSAETLLSKIKEGSLHPDLIVTELILEGIDGTNDFYGKRDGLITNCAKLLADELNIIGFKCKLIVLTSWNPKDLLKEVEADKRFSNVLEKYTSVEDFANVVNQLLA